MSHTDDEIEARIIQDLTALLRVPVMEGYIPGTCKTWAEQKAELARDLLRDLETWRKKRTRSHEKIYPISRCRFF